MWRDDWVYRVRPNHSQKTLRYVFGRSYENDLIYLISNNIIFKCPRLKNERIALLKVTGYKLIQ